MRDLDLLCQVKLTNRVIERERETKRNHYIKLQVSSSCFHFSGDTRILLFRWMSKVSEPFDGKDGAPVPSVRPCRCSQRSTMAANTQSFTYRRDLVKLFQVFISSINTLDFSMNNK